MIWTLEHKIFKEKPRAESIEHGEGKAQGEFESSLSLSNWNNITKRANINNMKCSVKEEAAISTSCSKNKI